MASSLRTALRVALRWRPPGRGNYDLVAAFEAIHRPCLLVSFYLLSV
jgi:hypothetical protein